MRDRESKVALYRAVLRQAFCNKSAYISVKLTRSERNSSGVEARNSSLITGGRVSDRGMQKVSERKKERNKGSDRGRERNE